MQRYDALCAESAAQRAGLRFVKHNVRNEFDDASDVARMFGVRSTPCFVFLVGGAKARLSVQSIRYVEVPVQSLATPWCRHKPRLSAYHARVQAPDAPPSQGLRHSPSSVRTRVA